MSKDEYMLHLCLSSHSCAMTFFTESESSSVFFTCPRSKRTSIQSLIFPLSMSFSLKMLSLDDICRCPQNGKIHTHGHHSVRYNAHHQKH